MLPMARRKQYLIDQRLQLRFARYAVFFVFLASLLTAITVFYTTFIILGDRLAQVYPQARLVVITRSAYLAFFVNILVILPIIFYGAILFSHRIAGPLPKIYQLLKEIGEGNFDTKLVLRKNDELQDLAEAINNMASELKGRFKK